MLARIVRKAGLAPARSRSKVEVNEEAALTLTLLPAPPVLYCC